MGCNVLDVCGFNCGTSSLQLTLLRPNTIDLFIFQSNRRWQGQTLLSTFIWVKIHSSNGHNFLLLVMKPNIGCMWTGLRLDGQQWSGCLQCHVRWSVIWWLTLLVCVSCTRALFLCCSTSWVSVCSFLKPFRYWKEKWSWIILELEFLTNFCQLYKIYHMMWNSLN